MNEMAGLFMHTRSLLAEGGHPMYNVDMERIMRG